MLLLVTVVVAGGCVGLTVSNISISITFLAGCFALLGVTFVLLFPIMFGVLVGGGFSLVYFLASGLTSLGAIFSKGFLTVY